MTAATLNRQTFATPRTAEYFDRKELQAQTGQLASNFAAVIVKELVDNALDASETASVRPEIAIAVDLTDAHLMIGINDNGPGMPSELVERILNFDVRVSDKSAYRAPTRGLQGNAIKTVFGIPHALGCDTPVIIEARGVRHAIAASVDPAGALHIDHDRTESSRTGGTEIVVSLPASAADMFDPFGWARRFALFNPHASVRIDVHDRRCELGKSADTVDAVSYQPSVDGSWAKPIPTDPTSPHHYDATALARLVFSHIAAGYDITVRDFVRQFAGLTGTKKAAAVCEQVGAQRLADFERDPRLITDLLVAMQDHARRPKPSKLGRIPDDHYRQCFGEWFGVHRNWVRRKAFEVDGIPWAVEVVVAETEMGGGVFYGVNYSPTFSDPLADTLLECAEFVTEGLGAFLDRAHVSTSRWGNDGSHAAALHIVSPSLEFLDRGKTRLRVPDPVAIQIGELLWSVCKTSYKEGERYRRDAATASRRSAQRRCQQTRPKVTLKDAVFEVLPEAYAKATGGNLPVSARSLLYAARPLVQQYTDAELGHNYFSQDLLVEYQREHGRLDLLYYDPRGNLHEPHTGKSVPLGTREIDEYRLPFCTFDKILFIEKEGLQPVLDAARLADRYDMAIVSGKGYPTEAARAVFDQANRRGGYRMFVLHDADVDGYGIARTMREATARMPTYDVDVVDIGLTVQEAIGRDLQTETFTRKKSLPAGLELNDVERGWFEGRPSGRHWIGTRAELNAFTNPDLIAFIEDKLTEHGADSKLIPSDEIVVDNAETYLFTSIARKIRDEIDSLVDVDEIAEALTREHASQLGEQIVNDLPAKLGDPSTSSLSWRDIVSALASMRAQDIDTKTRLRDALADISDDPDIQPEKGNRP